ncbi:unnamed protein product [Callosobruchus maculatus]|uniref:Uncharacterized protein n=1 Tax=Callosobruchus maculatus TaxID=64391 RepID=A0A653C9B2_CALMS|nr:unnamed protein product [Callosobruchus maculatus]
MHQKCKVYHNRLLNNRIWDFQFCTVYCVVRGEPFVYQTSYLYWLFCLSSNKKWTDILFVRKVFQGPWPNRKRSRKLILKTISKQSLELVELNNYY